MQVGKIVLMLGFNCNLHCSYCAQNHVDKRYDNSKLISKNTLDYIKNAADKISYPLHLTFFGGEPLLYLNVIEQTITALKDKDIIYTLTTNGKLLDQDTIKFLNRYNIHITLSWDGPNVINTRYYNVIEDKQDILFQLDSLTILGVLSKYNYINDFAKSLIPLNNRYYELRKKHISPMILPVRIDNQDPKSLDLIDIDYEKMRQQSEEACNIFVKSLINSKHFEPVYHSLISRYIRRMQLSSNITAPTCGSGTSVMNIDLDGNLYFCHNDLTRPLGSYKNSQIELWNKAANYIKCRDLYYNCCYNCPARAICLYGCPLLSDWQRDLYYCKLCQAIFEPMINTANYLINIGNTLEGA